MKEERYITLYMSKPIWNGERWTVWTGENPGKSHPYVLTIPVPEKLLAEVIEPVEIKEF